MKRVRGQPQGQNERTGYGYSVSKRLARPLDAVVGEHLPAVVEVCGGNRTLAVLMLDVPRSTVIRLLKHRVT